MTALLLAAGLGLIAGGSFAVAASGLTGALAGLLGVLVLAPLMADPSPSLLVIALRIVGALLAVELLWLALLRHPELRRASPLGTPAVILSGSAGALAALAIRPQPTVLGELLVGFDASGAALAAAVGLAVVALPAVLGRGPLGSLAVGAAVLLTAAELTVVALAGPRAPLEHVLIAVTQVALAAGAYVVALSAPMGPPLAGRAAGVGAAARAGGATGGEGAEAADEAPLTGRRRIPVWPRVSGRRPWLRGPRELGSDRADRDRVP